MVINQTTITKLAAKLERQKQAVKETEELIKVLQDLSKTK